jgi:hypothetical protein
MIRTLILSAILLATVSVTTLAKSEASAEAKAALVKQRQDESGRGQKPLVWQGFDKSSTPTAATEANKTTSPKTKSKLKKKDSKSKNNANSKAVLTK